MVSFKSLEKKGCSNSHSLLVHHVVFYLLNCPRQIGNEAYSFVSVSLDDSFRFPYRWGVTVNLQFYDHVREHIFYCQQHRPTGLWARQFVLLLQPTDEPSFLIVSMYASHDKVLRLFHSTIEAIWRWHFYGIYISAN